MPDAIFTCRRCLRAPHGSHCFGNTMSQVQYEAKTDKRQRQMMQTTTYLVSRHRGIYETPPPASLSPSNSHGTSLQVQIRRPQQIHHSPDIARDEVNISPMATFFLTLVLAASAAARGITEAPSAITPAAQADCPLTNSIPNCGVSRHRVVSLLYLFGYAGS